MLEVDGPIMDLEMQLLSSPTVPDEACKNGDGSSAKRIINKVILVVRSVQMFLEGISQGSPTVSRVSSSKSIDSSRDQQDEIKQARCEDMEEVAVEFVDADQTVPLLETDDISLHSWKQVRTLTHVIRIIQAFKSQAALVASAHVHHDISGAQKPEVSEASDSSAASSEHQITIVQPANRSQIENITKIVMQKNLLTLQEFGGLGGVKDALGTDLDKGISDEEALNRQHAPTRTTFLHFVWEEVGNKTILLLILAVALSIIFGIMEEGLYGLTDGVVVLIAIVLQVFIASIHKYWKQHRARKKLQIQQPEEGSVSGFHVIRGGQEKDIVESDLVYGDLVSLKKGCQVPADGLFVGGEDLELDYESESYIANEQNPFLSYGERVIKGEARMVVISTNMMIRTATFEPNMRFRLESHLDKLNTQINYTRIIISILIIVVLFLRFMAGRIDDENAYRPESMAEPIGIRSFTNAFAKFIKKSKYTTKALTKLLSVSLVGLTEGVSFVVSLAVVYWNKKRLSNKATEQDLHSILKTAAVTKICTDTFGELDEDDTQVQKVVIGGKLISDGRTLSPNVVEVLCDGIGTSKENAFLHDGEFKLGLSMERMKQRQIIEESEEMMLHIYGPLNEVMSKCTHYYNIQGEQVSMNDIVRSDFGKTNNEMESIHNLITIAIACKCTDTQTQDTEEWILVGLLGLKNKNKEATREEVKTCRECGIDIIIVSSKKLSVLKDIALQYGLITDNDPQSLVLTAEDFRKFTDKERLANVDKIRVLGEALSSDKSLLVETLRENGSIVAFLGKRTYEAHALIRADIGIAVGRWSSQKAIESSDIIIWDESISQITSMVDSGKCMYYNVQSFLQPLLIMTISSTLISFIQTAASGDASFTIVQSIWVNLAVVFLGGLGLLTKSAADKPVSLVPITCGRSLITAHMTRNILLQVSYQVTCLVIVQTKGSGTMVFNMFVTCQFFNLFNARELQKKNFFRCIHQHKEFWFAVTVFIVLHTTFVVVQDILGYGAILNWKLWAGCVLVGLLSWPVDWLGKCISWFWFIIKKFVNKFSNMQC